MSFTSATMKSTDTQSAVTKSAWLRFGLVFFVSFAVLFLLSDRAVGVFDESFPLVDALRILAGQVPHRDFYTPYGPAQNYILAVLFKLTFPSLLLAVLLDMAYKAAILATMFHVLSSFCRRILVYAGVLTAGLLIITANSNGSVLAPIALIVLWSTFLLNALLSDPVSRVRAYGIGVLAGLVVLFRYDIGSALIGLFLLLLCAALIQARRSTGRWNVWVLGPFVGGVLTAVVPLAWFYVATGAMQAFVFQLLVYPSKNYRAGRGVPFPHLALRAPLDTLVYVPFVIVGLAVGVFLILWLRRPEQRLGGSILAKARVGQACAVFVSLTAVMAMKGVIRVGIVGSFLGLLFGLVALCLLAEYVIDRAGAVRWVVGCVCVLIGLVTAYGAKLQLFNMGRAQALLAQSFRAPSSAEEKAWCADRNPLTWGVCYKVDLDREQSIPYIEQHTEPRDTLYVGVPGHDRIFANDNLMYFAAQRIPATRWSMFDPDLQNTLPIQKEMQAELEQTKLPLIVIDSEFLRNFEPNDSAKSSGVHLLDDYLAAHYKPAQVYGKLLIEQRR